VDLNRKVLAELKPTHYAVAFDYPTLYGYDTDHPLARGEFGKCGVAVSSLKDMEILLKGIPLEQVSTSMTINSPAAVIWAMYIVTAEKQGARPDQLRGTIQNDIGAGASGDQDGSRSAMPGLRVRLRMSPFSAGTVRISPCTSKTARTPVVKCRH
jgi:methylmalonyl-CoA mutase N-terminal domain/subunit